MPAPTEPTADTARTTPGRFDVTSRPDTDVAGRVVVEAWLVVDTPVGGRCIVTAEGFDDPDHYGTRTLRCALVPRTRGHWQFAEGSWRWLLSSWRGPEDEAAAADDWMKKRFAGIAVQVHRDDVTPSPRPLPARLPSQRAHAALASVVVAVGAIALPTGSQAQDYGAMIRQQMAAMDANIARGQQQVNGMVQQRMQDPAVQAAWQQYVMRSSGRPAMDYPTFTYNYIYTNGFSAQGIAHARNNEANNQARERAAWQGLQQAQQQRAAAMQAQRDGYSSNQQEAGRGLMGQSTYTAPNGQAMALPHTWQRNTTQQYQGNTYHVDASGQYHVLGTNGWWYPLAR